MASSKCRDRERNRPHGSHPERFDIEQSCHGEADQCRAEDDECASRCWDVVSAVFGRGVRRCRSAGQILAEEDQEHRQFDGDREHPRQCHERGEVQEGQARRSEGQ